jgi:dUTPase
MMKITAMNAAYIPRKIHPGDTAYHLFARIQSSTAEDVRYLVTETNRWVHMGDALQNYYLNGVQLFPSRPNHAQITTVTAALLEQHVAILLPKKEVIIPTGVSFKLDPYTTLNAERKEYGLPPLVRCMDIRPRTGLAFEHLITLPNSPGLVSETSEEELKIGLINHGNEVHFFSDKACIAELTFTTVEDWGDLKQYT